MNTKRFNLKRFKAKCFNVKFFNVIVVVVTFGIFLSFFLFHQGTESMMKAVRGLHLRWLLLAGAAMFLSWICEMLALHTILVSKLRIRSGLLRSLKFQMIGQFFGAISPFSAGSHPAQLYAMTKNGIPAGEAGSILMIKFMIHQVINIAILIVSLLCMFRYFNAKVQYFSYLCGLGLAVHIGVLIVTVLFCANPRLSGRLLAAVCGGLARVRLLKNAEAARSKMERELIDFHRSASFLKQRLGMCVRASLFTLLQYAAFFSMPYFVYRSFGLHEADMWTMLNAQIFLFNFMAVIPLPGAAGGAEGGFYFIYSLFFASNSILPALFVWRILSYYASIAVSSLFTLLLPNAKSRS
ncbi:flippase-like domain-containing protein [Paenibacillus lycopersici]|uniref:Phosphatidylglycerol lysyltransferase n=1 Tax=Paenibacillus lycopersici TaxID=2704462 RepID=A0A6C0FW87_9BACL|nr:lysylphosphatidylglycerol synthase transmembrane domain-containing protein [Paenibacillus lycopersici]QHT61388.1 flippase-like domain-containing protein [Paenibacillus lycopersici]